MTTLTDHASGPRRWFATGSGDGRAEGEARAPRWERPAFWGLLLGAAALFLWGLGASGYANSFYSAAAQAGSQSWKAFLFGSLDSSNAITVDKPPAALWPMALSVRLFGLGSWQILLPQALMGVGTVAVLHASVRRWFGAGAGLLAGGLMALTPVAALMFRFNNPDALLCLLTVCALHCLLRALERENSSVKWLVLCGVCLGLGFLVKTLQAWLILPALAVVYLACGPARLPRRIGALLLGGLAALVSAGWWVALTELWPAASRPYIGGSQTNSFLELTFGYNGFGRITGNETGSVGGGHVGGGPHHGGGGGGGWGQTGITRLFTPEMGGQIAWLLPSALILLAAGLVVTRRAARGDLRRAAFLAWGGSLLMTAVIFSFMSGIFHQYYNVALAPYIAAVAAMGAVLLWRRRGHIAPAVTLAVVVAGTALWAYVLLGRSPDWLPWLRWAVLAAGVLAGLGLLALRVLPRRLGAGLAVLGLAAALAGPVAYTLNTVRTPHAGSIVTAGPAVRGGVGFPGGFGGKGGARGRWAQFAEGMQRMGQRQQGQGQQGRGQQGHGRGWAGMNGQLAGRNGRFPAGGMPGRADSEGVPGGFGPMGGGRGGGGMSGGGMSGGGMGGLLNGQKVDAKVRSRVEKGAGRYAWMAAAIGSQNAASYQLSTQHPVMAVGGFNGSDPYPTLAQFKKYVEEGKIHYFIGGGRLGGPGMAAPGMDGAFPGTAKGTTKGNAKANSHGNGNGHGNSHGNGGLGRNFRAMGARGTSSSISAWVTKHYAKVTVDGVTLYDLTEKNK
jgi:4-amino-4-deoxy-L-arabinose transferase-like glycosyltransferase